MMQPQPFPFGASTLLVEREHADFCVGYEQGHEQYECRSRQSGLLVDTSTLLFLIGNGFAPGSSQMWQTGYIVGWLAACYEGGSNENVTGEHSTQGVA